MLAFRWILSLIYVVLNAVVMLLIGIIFLPWALISPKGARAACMCYCAWVIWLAKWLIGLKVEVRGTPPSGEVLIAAKHQSFLDIMVIYYHSPQAKYIMKREILWTPVIGLYAYRIGCVPVNRGKRGQAIKKMISDVKSGAATAGQLVIYSQGTRVKPGELAPYKVGTFALYDQLKQPCVPVATNAGLFWPKGTITRKAGVAVVEFLEPIAPGKAQAEFMAELEDVVETKSNDLMREAGFDV
ncbi:1-acyl-sn-glycerol-3-phosphate acyltransferase [Lentibacter algarum]|uniref:lysophospholipid acyltransferase family protein n=1 Tax=Lentibacter algarum TaxID=576131 RepID=UPI001C08FBA7|nr:lysophospholipid acyltransferase family protein [Lentibacter algarum]MBU2983571.1 1-acyl-sn-glycerol-3-phosphate acyltransferase [Lentibacter algarum]